MRPSFLFAVCVLLATATVAQSWRWFAPEVNCWITQRKVPASWEAALRSCQLNDAILASPLNTPLLDYMQSLIAVHNHSAAYFIGTRANRSHSQRVQYVSVEGRRLEEMPRAVFDAIDQLDLSQGDCLCMDRRGIRAVSCWDHLPYICYSNETTKCGSGYKYYPTTGSYYRFYKRQATWYAANATCASEGAHVLVVNDAAEANIVSQIVKDATGGTKDYYIWTGLRYNRPGGVMEWRTVNGESLSDVYNEWFGGHPYNDEERTCASYNRYYKRLWDEHCEYRHFNMCELTVQQ